MNLYFIYLGGVKKKSWKISISREFDIFKKSQNSYTNISSMLWCYIRHVNHVKRCDIYADDGIEEKGKCNRKNNNDSWHEAVKWTAFKSTSKFQIECKSSFRISDFWLNVVVVVVDINIALSISLLVVTVENVKKNK
jgi:hypothetical protein